MTAQELIQAAGRHPILLAGFLAAPPILAFLLGLVHGRDRGVKSPWKYCYSILVYAACIPGMAAAVLTGYALFFTGENLLKKDLLVYFLPLAAMGATLLLVRRRAAFEKLPGFERLSGLMLTLGCTFVILLAIRKTWIGLFFGASLAKLAIVASALFGLLKLGLAKVAGNRDEAGAGPDDDIGGKLPLG